MVEHCLTSMSYTAAVHLFYCQFKQAFKYFGWRQIVTILISAHLIAFLMHGSNLYKKTSNCFIPVNKLIKDNHVARMNILLERTTGCCSNYAVTAFFFQCPYVCPIIDIGWIYRMLTVMPIFTKINKIKLTTSQTM